MQIDIPSAPPPPSLSSLRYPRCNPGNPGIQLSSKMNHITLRSQVFILPLPYTRMLGKPLYIFLMKHITPTTFKNRDKCQWQPR